uniref:Uncharacterized protein n=1 Tax=viral metagenome TaxID=1070528 RepID=A0A6M3LSJ7_9ZZZZ
MATIKEIVHKKCQHCSEPCKQLPTTDIIWCDYKAKPVKSAKKGGSK